MNGLRDKVRRFMVGRYGMDELNRFLSLMILVFVVFNLFVRRWSFFWLELLCLILVYARALSKNTGQRFRENQAYLHFSFRAKEWAKGVPVRLKESRKYKIFRCPNCGQKLRIPEAMERSRFTAAAAGMILWGGVKNIPVSS